MTFEYPFEDDYGFDDYVCIALSQHLEEFCKDKVVEMMRNFHKEKDTSVWEITGFLCKQKNSQELAENWD